MDARRAHICLLCAASLALPTSRVGIVIQNSSQVTGLPEFSSQFVNEPHNSGSISFLGFLENELKSY